MRGQAFVVFEEQSAATAAMRALVGEEFYGRPLVSTHCCLLHRARSGGSSTRTLASETGGYLGRSGCERGDARILPEKSLSNVLDCVTRARPSRRSNQELRATENLGRRGRCALHHRAGNTADKASEPLIVRTRWLSSRRIMFHMGSADPVQLPAFGAVRRHDPLCNCVPR